MLSLNTQVRSEHLTRTQHILLQKGHHELGRRHQTSTHIGIPIRGTKCIITTQHVRSGTNNEKCRQSWSDIASFIKIEDGVYPMVSSALWDRNVLVIPPSQAHFTQFASKARSCLHYLSWSVLSSLSRTTLSISPYLFHVPGADRARLRLTNYFSSTAAQRWSNLNYNLRSTIAASAYQGLHSPEL